MARSFSSDSDQISNTSFAANPTAAGTFSLWAKPTWNSGDSASHEFWTMFDGSVEFVKFSDNNIYVGFNTPSDQRIVIADTGLFTSGTWANWAFTWSAAAGQAIYKNGVSKGTTGAITVGSGNQPQYLIGRGLGTGRSVAATLAEFCYWSVILSAGELLALATGAHPKQVRPGSIVAYLPIWGLTSPEPDLGGTAYNGTVAGTALAGGPPVSMITRRQPQFIPGAAAAGFFGRYYYDKGAQINA